ncbi:MAG: hypothetical protein RR725_04220 [Carnobacterium sp.]
MITQGKTSGLFSVIKGRISWENRVIKMFLEFLWYDIKQESKLVVGRESHE